MIQSIQKVIKIGSSAGVTIPAKDLSRQKISFGDQVEVIIRPIDKISPEDHEVISTAKRILDAYKRDFQNLSKK